MKCPFDLAAEDVWPTARNPTGTLIDTIATSLMLACSALALAAGSISRTTHWNNG